MQLADHKGATALLSVPWDRLGDIDAELAAKLIAATADIALVVDGDGVIQDVTIGSESLPRAQIAGWRGRRWVETVTVESRGKVEDILRDAKTRGASRWRQVNHPAPEGIDLPVRYCGVKVGSDGWTIVIGRELQAMAALQQRLVEAQQSMEREYARLRSAETRYRLLFQMASEAVLIVDAASQRILDANPAASHALGIAPKRLAGRSFADLFDSQSAAAIETLQAALRVTGRANAVRARLAGQSGDLVLSASLFRHDSASQTLVWLRRPRDGADGAETVAQAGVLRVVESLPDGFAVTDGEGRILTANAAFLELAQLPTEDAARGELLERWLGRPAVDMTVVISTLQEGQMVRRLATIVRGELGSVEDVEISAVAASAGEQPCFGFTISRLPRSKSDPGKTRELPRSVEQLTNLVGRMSLKDIVRDTTDLIERLCIEAALQVTNDNRASAAEMLGLSRQGLYSKLRRYGLGDNGLGGSDLE